MQFFIDLEWSRTDKKRFGNLDRTPWEASSPVSDEAVRSYTPHLYIFAASLMLVEYFETFFLLGLNGI